MYMKAVTEKNDTCMCHRAELYWVFQLVGNPEILHLYLGSKYNKQVYFPIFKQQFFKNI